MSAIVEEQVKIVEVGPRDGLQNEIKLVPTKKKIEFIDALSDSGFSTIEVTSFVSPKWVPQLADAPEVFAGIHKNKNITYPVLVPNMKGLEHALAVGVTDISVFTTPSEKFSQKNTNCTVSESIKRIEEVVSNAKQQGLWVRAYISCVLGCPYEGEMAPSKVLAIAETLLKMGCDEISLGDTIGVGTTLKTKRLLEMLTKTIPVSQLAVHFHDTYGQALANIYVALQEGIRVIDSSVAGLGGCPYAKGASGNVATEDVLYMLYGMNMKTGVDLKKVIAVGRMISKWIGRQPQSKVNIAMGGLF